MNNIWDSPPRVLLAVCKSPQPIRHGEDSIETNAYVPNGGVAVSQYKNARGVCLAPFSTGVSIVLMYLTILVCLEIYAQYVYILFCESIL